MNTTEAIAFVKTLKISDVEKGKMLVDLIKASGNEKVTVLTKTAPAPAKTAKTAPAPAKTAKTAKTAPAPAKTAKTAKTAPAPAPAKTAKTAKPAGEIKIINYSEKAFAVIGDTKPVKDILKSLNGRFNAFLKVNGETVPGWIFGIKHLPDVTAALQ